MEQKIDRDQELEALRAEITRLKAQKATKITLGVSTNGCVEFHPLRGKWCPRLDIDECEAVIEVVETGALRTFIDVNRDRLVTTAQRHANKRSQAVSN